MKKVTFISWLVVILPVLAHTPSIAQEGGIQTDVPRTVFGYPDQTGYLSRAPSAARGGRIQTGNLTVIPGIGLEGVHDDNIYLGNGTEDPFEEEVSDWISLVSPSLLFDYAFAERGGLRFGYEGALAFYNDNDQNNWQRHEGFVDLNYHAPGGLVLGIDNLYVDTDDPYSSTNQYKLGVPQIQRWYDRLNTKIGYDFNDQFRLLAYYNFYQQEYADEIDYSQNYKSNEVGAGGEFRIMPKTWGLIRYHYGERDYDTHPPGTGLTESNDADFEWRRVNAGLTWDATAKIRGELNFGYYLRNYVNITDVNGNAYEDMDTWIARTVISLDATPTTGFAFVLAREPRDVGSNTTAYFIDTGVSLNVRQVIVDKVVLYVGGTYSTNDYNVPEPEKRKDDNIKARIDLQYMIQEWLSAGISYQYWKRDSNYLGYDFTDNRIGVSVNLAY
ncbi:MAG: outer membrane beta-barrel protein [Deltaproteobacteria bacterium]|nr:outer membrane beta-barrel protein [Deltaproteobacteria bacterium]